MSGIKVVVTTSDRYLGSLRPFAHLFNQYWSDTQPVEVFGFAAPPFGLPGNFTFTSLGSMEDYPFERWGAAFIEVMNRMDDEHFILMLEDYWLIRDVDQEAIQILWHYCEQFQDVIRMDLTTDRLYAGHADINYDFVGRLDLVKSMPGSPYHMSLMSAIWNKRLLQQLVIPDESPHGLELQGSLRLGHMQNMRVLGTRQAPLRYTLGYRNQDASTANVGELRKHDRDFLMEMGWI